MKSLWFESFLCLSSVASFRGKVEDGEGKKVYHLIFLESHLEV